MLPNEDSCLASIQINNNENIITAILLVFNVETRTLYSSQLFV